MEVIEHVDNKEDFVKNLSLLLKVLKIKIKK